MATLATPTRDLVNTSMQWCQSALHASRPHDPVECVIINGAHVCQKCLLTLIPRDWLSQAIDVADFYDYIADDIREAAYEAALNAVRRLRRNGS